ncbi:MAG TPA: M15 family metallopeptidase [Bosea sp. (in: a-proteobacteria)]
MVRVPEYQSNVALRPDLRQDVEVRATPEAFGADIGRGMQGLAKGLDNAGDQMAAVRELEDVARAKEADNKYANWMRERQYGEGGFMTQEGRNAVDGRAAFEREAEEKRKEFSQGLTPGAAKAYSTASTARLQSTYQQSIIHTANERKKWFGQASNARVETFANDALVAFDKPAMVNKNIAAGILELREQGALHGWDADTLKQREADFSSGVHKNITLRLAQGDPLKAEKYMKDNAGRMTGAHQYELQKSLESEIQSEASKRAADGILGSGRQPVAAPAGPAPAAGERRTLGQAGPTQARAFLIGKLNGNSAAHVDGLDEGFATNLAALIQDAPPGIREKLGVQSGFRSIERQRQLFAASDGSGKMVAPPGRSFHNHGQAVDLAYDGRSLKHAPKDVIDWVHGNAGKYGMFFPMAYEPWHIEPVGTRGGQDSGTVAPRNNMVSARSAMPSFDEIEAKLQAIPDDKVRDLTRKRVYTAIEARSKYAQEQEKVAKSELWSYIDKGATPDQVPMEVRQAAGMAAVSSAWNYLETAAKGRAVDSDETLLYDMRRYAAQKPTEFANVDLNDFRDRLSKEAIKELTTTQTTALTDQRKAREDGITLTTAFSQATSQLEAVGITATGKDGKQREEAAKRIAQFQNALAGELEAFKKLNNKNPNQIEIQAMTNKLLLPIVIKQPGMLWDSNDRSKRLFEAAGRPDGTTVDVDVKYADIPIDLRRGIATDLQRELGRKPSEEEIISRYEEVALSR